MNSNAKNINPRESILSVLILLILVLIAAFIFLQQFQFNPAVSIYIEGQTSAGAKAPDGGTREAASLIDLPPGISPLSPAETFTPETLSDKINGKAELYLSAGFKRLQSQRYRIDTRPALWMEIYIFDMGSHTNAFAVFSSQQRDDAVPTGLGAFSYRTENALYWIHGHYYLEFIASEAASSALEHMQSIGEAFNRAVPVESGSISGPQLFPQSGRIPDSINLIAANAFGFEKLDQVFTAEYRLADTTLTAFVSQRPSAQAAETLAGDYRDFLMAFGGQPMQLPPQAPPANAAVIEILDTYEVIFTRGPYLAGIHEAPDSNQALRLAEMLDDKLKEHVGEKTD